MLLYATVHMLATISLLFYMAFGYQSLSSLNSKRSLWYACLANPLVILEPGSITFLECSSTFRVMAWRNFMYKDISLHNAFTYYFKIMDNTPPCVLHYQCPFTFLCSDRHLLLIAQQTCTFNGDFTIA